MSSIVGIAHLDAGCIRYTAMQINDTRHVYSTIDVSWIVYCTVKSVAKLDYGDHGAFWDICVIL